MSDENRLDRIEALIEGLGQKVESNARAIEALSDASGEAKRDRANLYRAMADLAQSQANLHQAQARFYERLEQAEERQEQFERQQNERQERFERQQGDIVEILKFLTQQNRQQS